MKSVIIVFLTLIFSVSSTLWSAREGKRSQKRENGMILDGFEANDWIPSMGEGTYIKTSLVPGIDGKALKVDYNLSGSEKWVQIYKDIPIKDLNKKALRFYLRATGKNVNNIEVKLVDEDGTNFGVKRPMEPTGKWEEMTLALPDFTYWWGGNPVLDGVKQIWIAFSAREGGKGSVRLDDLRLVKSDRKAPEIVKSGLIDDCDTIESWIVEGEDGTSSKLISIKGKRKAAVGVDYDLGSGNWIQITKPLRIELSDDSVFQFYMKWVGDKNNLEFKVVDNDNSNFGKKFEFSGEAGTWQKIKIPVSELTYWWGGDKELDQKNIKAIWIAISKLDGGKGIFAIDQLSLN